MKAKNEGNENDPILGSDASDGDKVPVFNFLSITVNLLKESFIRFQ